MNSLWQALSTVGGAFRVVRRRWLLGLIVASVMGSLFIGITWLQGPSYKATMIVGDATRLTRSSSGGLLNTLGGALGGLSDGLSAAASIQQLVGGAGSLASYQYMLKSPTVARILLTERDVVPLLWPPGAVDYATKTWRVGTVRGIINNYYEFFGAPRDPRITADDVATAINRIVTFNEDPISGVLQVVCRSGRQEVCAPLLTMVHEETDKALRGIRKDQALQIQYYLQQRLPEVTLVEVRRGMLELMESALRQEVLADTTASSVVLVLGQPKDSVETVMAGPFFLVVTSGAFGVFCALLVIFAAEARQRTRAWQRQQAYLEQQEQDQSPYSTAA
ncbi:hypothetical protein [Zavarzinia sp. CC-PAN008]|uniref:hypothetical protein n=1 Tax=Zavarzinia sp. CC-PAN008 TaxID=3243332 RepID=UPI003F744D0C